MLKDLRLEDFTDFVNQNFSLSLGDEQFEMLLSDAKLSQYQAPEEEGFRKAFSLFFEPLDNRQYPQGTYKVTHPSLEEPLSLFMTPVLSRNQYGFVMQVAFN